MSDEIKTPYPYRIREFRVARGMKIADLASKINITNQYLSLIETGKRNLTPELESKIAEALSCAPQDLHYRTEKADRLPTIAAELSSLQQTARESIVNQGDDLPVFATVLAQDGLIKLSTEIVGWIARPEPLLKVKGGFALYVPDDTMSPAYNEGDLILVRTSRPAHQGEDVLAVSNFGDQNFREIWIRRLEKSIPNRLLLKQWNPLQNTEIELSRIAEIHPIVGVFRR